MQTVKIIQICLLAACLSNELHEDDLEMAGMRRAIEQSTKEREIARNLAVQEYHIPL